MGQRLSGPIGLRRMALGVAVALAVLAHAAGAQPAEGRPEAGDHAAAAMPAAGGAELAFKALSFLGVPYRFGGDDPGRGFDCSGLVRHVARSVLGLDLPRRSEDMARGGRPVAARALEAGDLVFFNLRGRPNSHVGVYLGDGRFVHAPARNGLVRIEAIDARYWRSRFSGARRLHHEGIAAAQAAEVDQASAPQAEPRPVRPLPDPDAGA